MFLIILTIAVIIALGIFTAVNSIRLDKLEEDYYEMKKKEILAREKLLFIQDEVDKVDILKTNPYSVLRQIKETINSDQTIR